MELSESFTSAAESLLLTIGETGVAGALTFLARVGRDVLRAYNSVPKPIQTTISILTLLGPVALAAGASLRILALAAEYSSLAALRTSTSVILANTGITKLVGLTRIATAAQWAWNAALVANPIGLTVAAVGTLIVATAALVYWQSRRDDSDAQFLNTLGLRTTLEQDLAQALKDQDTSAQSLIMTLGQLAERRREDQRQALTTRITEELQRQGISVLSYLQSQGLPPGAARLFGFDPVAAELQKTLLELRSPEEFVRGREASEAVARRQELEDETGLRGSGIFDLIARGFEQYIVRQTSQFGPGTPVTPEGVAIRNFTGDTNFFIEGDVTSETLNELEDLLPRVFEESE